MFIKYCKDRVKTLDFILIMGLFFVLGFLIGIYFTFLNFSLRNLLMSYCAAILVPIGLLIIEYIFKMKFTLITLLMAVFVCIGGMFIGPMFDMFVKTIWFDKLLHLISGMFIFFCGYSLSSRVLDKNKKLYKIYCLFFAATFTIFLLNLWEIYEYICTKFLGLDMQDDRLITEIGSTYLAQSNNFVMHLYNIVKTVIYHVNNEVYVIEGGYLDIGLYDTLEDILIGFVGIIIGSLILLINQKLLFKNKNLFVPSGFNVTNNNIEYKE